MYYTSLEYFEKKYDACPKEYAFQASTTEEHRAWRDAAARRLREIAGIDRCVRVQPKERCVSVTRENGRRKEYWLMQTEPGVWMPFYLLRREDDGGADGRKHPVLLNPHGHGGGKETTVDTDFAREMADAGWYVFCPDERGSGERREFPQQSDDEAMRRGSSHRELLQLAIGFGQSVIGLAVWDLMCLLDMVQTWPDADGERIACAGMSGGGQQTLWLSAIDERVKAAIVSGYFYGMRDSLVSLPQNCACNFVPHLWETMDMGDMGAMIAPRALFVESGEKDPLEGKRGLENVYPQVMTAKRAFALYGKADSVVHSIHDGGHEWRGDGMKEFLEREVKTIETAVGMV